MLHGPEVDLITYQRDDYIIWYIKCILSSMVLTCAYSVLHYK